jgi:F-type H+-transporting ATPase subunit alpha
MRHMAGPLKLELAQHKELSAFSQFVSDMDSTTRRQLERGNRLVEILKQAPYSPESLERQLAVLFLGVNGYLDSVPLPEVESWTHDALLALQTARPELMQVLHSQTVLSPEILKSLAAFFDQFDKDRGAS